VRRNGSKRPNVGALPPRLDGKLVRLHPLGDTVHISQDRALLATGQNGFIAEGSKHGFFVEETRLLSRYEYTINGKLPFPVALSSVRQHSWLGYYVTLPAEVDPKPSDRGSGLMEKLSEESVEVVVARTVGGGLHEDVAITNFAQSETSFELALAIDADFADPGELHHGREQEGRLTTDWRFADGKWELDFDYQVSHEYEHQGERGERALRRGVRARVRHADSEPRYQGGEIRFAVRLQPQQSWRLCLHHIPRSESRERPPVYGCYGFADDDNVYERARDAFLMRSTQFSGPVGNTLADTVVGAVERARHDLAALRLHDLDHPPHGWTMAAGLPLYIALFGRDVLTAGWQSALASPQMMYGAAAELAKWQGTEDNHWRDERPGKMLHEAHNGPLAMLGYNPRQRYYGAVTTSSFYLVLVSELWHWTGNKDLIYPLLGPAMKSLEGIERYGDLNGDGFVDYLSRSEQGNRHQGWKDSANAVVYPNGQQVDPPIATCEEQGFLYAAKWQFAEVLWWMDKKEEARRIFHEAEEFKKRFNEAFWMANEGFIAFGLDAQRQPIKSIASNPGHCIATGIVDTALVEKVADRLFEPDMFSGWGIRTLSSGNPAYNPYSYHRGSIWPVEHGAFAIGFMRYGLLGHLHKMAKGMFEAAAMFDFYRLPEVFSGHARDEQHPFPAVYPKTCWPQAWSASVHFSILQALLGIYPYAPLKLLLVDPQLPDWLPAITLSRLQVGSAFVTLRFFRTESGSDYEILEQEGSVHVVRQPSPWSLSAGFGERLRHLASSLVMH
jgi:glycogen debranching enzyme